MIKIFFRSRCNKICFIISTKQIIIDGSLIHINKLGFLFIKLGWNHKAILQACEDADLSSVHIYYLRPHLEF
jgi:hypothetical protein